ncbi:CAP domain-containing protein [Streptomyces caniscabiei]|uniref:TerD family protein n=2 Tax=Streptomyces caniscabiei TaxID=2746961 RepID=A0A927L2U6_9ACTN|nr:CAP domain-containing protein [Streptomyces caniscabiei]MBD9723921.1 TerD family protein [Streptomyces caniscabiei]MDX3511425.1 CAP domain-containing protein [Streptomyces caniscabiei]MDX3718394.1 CAP domain-containing protein [Streptomyces caniscabiei]WEO22194.1 CAP domain-containing protein [Streptomyces caniscabiei]
MNALVPGGNIPLPSGTLTIRVPGPFDVSALVTDDTGRVRGDADFVFYNQPTAPGARLAGDTLTVTPTALRPGATRLTLAISPAAPDTPLGHLPTPTLLVTTPDGRTIARFTPPRPARETVLLLAELYRKGQGWKLRALGLGYADGLAGVARDFGVEVLEDATAGAPRQGRGEPHAQPPPTRARPTTPPSPASVPTRFLDLVNSARATAGSPPVSPDARLSAAAQAHATAMAAQRRLATEGKDGLSVHQRVTATGYAYLTIGEHLVSGPRDPAEFVDHCLSARQARQTLHDPTCTETGLGQATDPRSGTVYWTALWAQPFSLAGLRRTATEVITLTNTERARAGLPPLSPDPRLTDAAQAHSADMVARAFYAHTSPDGGEPWHRAAAVGSTLRSIGENIACGQRSAAEVVLGWMNSPGHRANILKPGFTRIGIGFVGGGAAGTYWTQLFGG